MNQNQTYSCMCARNGIFLLMTEEGRIGASTAEDAGKDLHQRRLTAGSTHGRKRLKEWILIGRGASRASTSTDGGRVVIHFVDRIDRTRDRSEIGRTERKLVNRKKSRTVGNRTNSKERNKKGWKSTELENGRKSEELKSAKQVRLEIERTRERSEIGRTQKRETREVGNRTNSRTVGNRTN